MKKLMIAALMACSFCALADAPASQPAAAKDAKAPTAQRAKDAKAPTAQRAKLSPEQRKASREKIMAARQARQAEINAKVTAALKEGGMGDQQAKDMADRIEKIYMEGRRPMGMGPRHGGPRRAARPGAPAPAAK